jgi:hypothetical protein
VLRRRQIVLLAFILCLASLVVRSSHADGAIDCSTTALAGETQTSAAEVQSLAARPQSSTNSPNPSELESVLDHVTTLQDHLSICSTKSTGEDRDSDIVAIFTAAYARVALLKRLNQPQAANALATQTGADILKQLSNAAPPLGSDAVQRLTALRVTILGLPAPQSPVQDWCAAHGLAKGSTSGVYCTQAASYQEIEDWCVGASVGLATTLSSATQAYCVQLLTGQSTGPDNLPGSPQCDADIVACSKRALGYSTQCASNPARCADENLIFRFASLRTLSFPDDAFLAGLSRDERTLAVRVGVPCHIERFTRANYYQQTWWYCDSDGNYLRAFTFLNGKYESSYTP